MQDIPDIVIRKSGNLIDISQNGLPLTKLIARELEKELTYVYVKSLYGQAEFEHGKTLDFEPRRLYKYDSKGRMICGRGHLNKITRLLIDKFQVSPTLINKDPKDHPRPRRYEERVDIVDQNVTYRPKQEECLEAISANECGIIAAPTGFGKGMIILMVCLLYPYAKIHIITPGKDLVSKTVRLLSKTLPNIGQVGFGSKRINRITVFSADSLHLSDFDADILIVDEAHELMAPTYGQYLAKYRFSRNYAFTATPTGRADKADSKMESLFGETIFSVTYQEAVQLGLVVQINVDWLDVPSDNPAENYVTRIAKKRYGVWRNWDRNNTIAEKLKQYTNDQVLILVTTLEHALNLRQHLPDYSLCYDKLTAHKRKQFVKAGLMEPDEAVITPRQREQMRLDFETGKLKHVIATTIWATGVSFDALPVLVWAAGGSSEIRSTQVPGRVCRIHESSGKQFGVLIDCCDQFDSGFENQANTRCRYYKKHGWAQVYDGRITRRKRNQI